MCSLMFSHDSKWELTELSGSGEKLFPQSKYDVQFHYFLLARVTVYSW